MNDRKLTDAAEKWLAKKGYLTKREVRLTYRTADIVGFKHPDKFLAIEVKGEFDDPIRGIGQALTYGNCTDESYLAVDKKKFHEIRDIIKYIPVGVLVANRGELAVKKKSLLFRPKPFWKRYLKGVFLKIKPIDGTKEHLIFPKNPTPEMRRLIRSLTIESLWYWILKILEDTPCHAYILQEVISNRFGFKPSKIACYKVIYFLEKGEYVKVRREGNRKIYALTRKGEIEMEKGKGFINELIN